MSVKKSFRYDIVRIENVNVWKAAAILLYYDLKYNESEIASAEIVEKSERK
jgi:hypothetical protein